MGHGKRSLHLKPAAVGIKIDYFLFHFACSLFQPNNSTARALLGRSREVHEAFEISLARSASQELPAAKTFRHFVPNRETVAGRRAVEEFALRLLLGLGRADAPVLAKPP